MGSEFRDRDRRFENSVVEFVENDRKKQKMIFICKIFSEKNRPEIFFSEKFSVPRVQNE